MRFSFLCCTPLLEGAPALARLAYLHLLKFRAAGRSFYLGSFFFYLEKYILRKIKKNEILFGNPTKKRKGTYNHCLKN